MLKAKLSVLALFAGSVLAQSAVAADKVDAKYIEEASYAVGILMGQGMKDNIDDVIESQKNLFSYDKASVLKGIDDALKGNEKLDKDALQAKLESLDKILLEKSKQLDEERAKNTMAQGDKFRADFEKQAGVKKSSSGLLYKIEKAGEGESPKATDTVKVHYKGTLTDGTVFDSSYERGEPIEFQLNQLIPAWIEAIPMLKKGGKMEIVAPPALAYGNRAAGKIPPNSTLKFEIELLDFKAK
ncbi:peptidylprolyl isomerase [Pasteurellaceae bacterium RH1A]|nr:peptidylprolyl isomerase [Pasteurellaceae bacterium RH1A]